MRIHYNCAQTINELICDVVTSAHGAPQWVEQITGRTFTRPFAAELRNGQVRELASFMAKRLRTFRAFVTLCAVFIDARSCCASC
jgi:hypothetical protein